jgi:hypothetical protein
VSEKKSSIVKPHTVVAAGMASATAAFFTSSIGVAGTIIGAALTSMIITTGSAILGVKLESASTKLSRLPKTVREKVSTTSTVNRTGERPAASDLPGRESAPAGMRVYGSGSQRSSRQRFSNLSPRSRRSVLVGGLAAGAVAFFISMGGITAVEAAMGQSFSCWWNEECVAGESTLDGTTVQQGSTTTFGQITERARSGTATDTFTQDPTMNQPTEPGGGLRDFFGGGQQQDPAAPETQPSSPWTPDEQTAPGTTQPAQPTPTQPTPTQPAPTQPAPTDPAPGT